MRWEVSRAFAGFLAVFGFFSAIGEWMHSYGIWNLWWIDLRFLPAPIADGIVLASSILLAAYSLRPVMGQHRRTATLFFVSTLFLVSIQNSAQFFWLLSSDRIDSAMLFPLSLSLAIGLALLMASMWRRHTQPAVAFRAAHFALPFAAFVFVFPLGQMICFGKTSYERGHVDAIVVFGARVYVDGRPSDALADRMRTAIRLALEQKGSALILSGGPGDGVFHETDVMKRMALDRGVPERSIFIDREGFNTQATVRNVKARLGSDRHRVLAVSHFYHLPRVKMAFASHGIEAFTVPAKESYTLTKLPLFMAREVLAFWVQYGRGFLSS